MEEVHERLVGIEGWLRTKAEAHRDDGPEIDEVERGTYAEALAAAAAVLALTWLVRLNGWAQQRPAWWRWAVVGLVVVSVALVVLSLTLTAWLVGMWRWLLATLVAALAIAAVVLIVVLWL